MSRVVFAIVAVCALPILVTAGAAGGGQAASSGAAATVTLTGRVLSDESGDALPNAHVTLATAANAIGTPVVLTDADGRFALKVAGGRHTLAVAKTGYARRAVPAPQPGDTVEIRLQRGAAISGRVLDEFGDPLSGVNVFVEAAPDGSNTDSRAPAPGPPAPGASNAEPAASFRPLRTNTDDRGEYRVGSLPPGEFVVAVLVIGGPRFEPGPNQTFIMNPTSERTYYPDVSSPDDAEWLQLRPGDDRSSIDFVVAGGESVGNPNNVVIFMARPPMAPRAPAPGTPTGVIRGRVVSTDGRGLGHAQVRIVPRNLNLDQSRAGTADEEGNYEFVDVAAGAYRVLASKVGYSPIADTASPAMPGPPLLSSGTSVDLSDGQIRERVDVRLERWGSLAGQVFDELGDPVEGANVQLLQVRYEGGRRRLVPAGSATRVTDDLGRYRLFAFPPGNYIVSAGGGDLFASNMPGYGRTYFPSTPNAGEAQFVSLRAGQDLAGIDVTLARIQTASVTGRMIDSNGGPTMGGTVNMVPSRRGTAVTSVPIGARIGNDGAFEFPNVPPGQYVIQAYRGRKNRSIEDEFGALPVSVAGTDVSGLVLQMSAGSTISGRVTFDTLDRTKLPSPGAIELSPVPIDFDASPASYAVAEIEKDWTFHMSGINGPRRLQVMRAPAGWAMKQILVNGIDATDRALAFGRKDQSLTDVEVVMTDRISEVIGTVADDHGQLVPGGVVIVFPTDRDRWYPSSRFLARAATIADGTYSLAGLPFGSYYVAAVATLPTDGAESWQDPEFLTALIARASSIVISEGQRQSLNLRVVVPGAR